MKAKLPGLLLVAMVVPECAEARGGGGGGLGGLLILIPFLAVIGFGAYWLLSKLIGGKDKTKGHFSADGLLFYALFGLMALIVSVPFILLGTFLWGATYSNRVTTGQAVPGIVFFSVVCFFIARWLWRSVQSARARAAQQMTRCADPHAGTARANAAPSAGEPASAQLRGNGMKARNIWEKPLADLRPGGLQSPTPAPAPPLKRNNGA